jgi:hypothetical protein
MQARFVILAKSAASSATTRRAVVHMWLSTTARGNGVDLMRSVCRAPWKLLQRVAEQVLSQRRQLVHVWRNDCDKTKSIQQIQQITKLVILRSYYITQKKNKSKRNWFLLVFIYFFHFFQIYHWLFIDSSYIFHRFFFDFLYFFYWFFIDFD